MRKRKLVSLIASLSIALILPAASMSHTLTTAHGTSITHTHQSSCAGGCISNSYLESAPFNFSSATRVYSSTWSWNCHGRTFDNRISWVYYADQWLLDDGPYCPVNPSVGQTIIWWDGSKTSHSVTIVGPWNGTSTLVMSKYGAYGQYRHALSNAVTVYGSNWAVTGFSGGTAIYSSSTAKDSNSQLNEEENPGERLLEERKLMPWYKDVLASEIIYAVEHPRLVAHSASLSDDTRARLQTSTDELEQIEILLDDLRQPTHYEALALYNRPSLAKDFIEAIEAGRLLSKIAARSPELRGEVLSRLAQTASAKKSSDGLRGAAIYFISTTGTEDEVRAIRSRILASRAKLRIYAEDRETSSYEQYYLQRMVN
jgi:hypothetical protein